MKNLFSFILLACTLAFTVTSTASEVVQQSLDKNIFVASAETVYFDYVTVNVIGCVFDVNSTIPLRTIDSGYISYNYKTPELFLTIIDSGRDKLITYKSLSIPNKDVVWLTNMKSK